MFLTYEPEEEFETILIKDLSNFDVILQTYIWALGLWLIVKDFKNYHFL